MSSKIEYDIKSLDIGIDSKGNMALSDKGNLVTPIQPFSVRVNFGEQHVAPDGSITNEGVAWNCSRLRLVGNEKNSFASCIGGANAIYDYNEYRVKQNSGSYQVIANARDLAKRNSRYELAIFGAISVPGNAENAQSAPVTVTVRWGFASTELTVFVCHEMKKLATAIVDFDGLSITLNKGTADDEPFECSPGSEIEIPIYAPYAWCADQDSRPGDTGEYFTESLLPIPEISYIWRNMDTVVTVEGDETEAEALAAAAFGVVASVEMRDYIVGDAQYWRSPQNDVIIGDGYKKKLMVYGTVLWGRSDNYNNHEFVEKDLWVEQNSTSAFPNETTKRIFKKAYSGTGDPDNPAEYELNKCLLSAKTKIYVDTNAVGISTIFYRRVSSDGGAIFAYGYAKKTGNSVSLTNPNFPDLPAEVFEEYEVFDGSERRWISGFSTGYTAALPGKPHWEPGDGPEGYVLKPDNHDEFGQTHPVTSAYGRVFLHDDGYYYASARTSNDFGLNGYVYELDTLKAWTTTPCSQQTITVYTDMESPAVDDDYYFYDKESKVKSFAGKIVQVGNSAYSITDKNGVKYYFKEDRSNDEEFE